jgi:hypothetical protein
MPVPPGGVPWPSRLEALLSAFAWEAAERERDTLVVLERFDERFSKEK